MVDDPVNIRRGDITEVRIGGGSQQLLSDQDFIRTYARHQSWWPVGLRDVFFLRTEVGYTLASSRFGIPQEYLFRAGGIQSLRGYDFKGIGVHEGDAIVGGRVMATGTAEYTHWVTQQWGQRRLPTSAVRPTAGRTCKCFLPMAQVFAGGVRRDHLHSTWLGGTKPARCVCIFQ